MFVVLGGLIYIASVNFQFERDDFKYDCERKMKQLQKADIWTLQKTETIDGYLYMENGDNEAIVYILRKN